jgi:hypothetical protein
MSKPVLQNARQNCQRHEKATSLCFAVLIKKFYVFDKEARALFLTGTRDLTKHNKNNGRGITRFF